MWRLKRWSLSPLPVLFLALFCLSGQVGLYGEETYTIYASELQELNATIGRQRERLADLKRSWALLKASSGDLEELLARYEARLNNYEETTNRLEQTISDLEIYNNQLKSHLATARALLTDLRTELETLKTSFNEYKSAARSEIRGAWFKGGVLGFGVGTLATILFGLLGGLR